MTDSQLDPETVKNLAGKLATLKLDEQEATLLSRIMSAAADAATISAAADVLERSMGAASRSAEPGGTPSDEATTPEARMEALRQQMVDSFTPGVVANFPWHVPPRVKHEPLAGNPAAPGPISPIEPDDGIPN
jgi:hypothetical protein